MRQIKKGSLNISVDVYIIDSTDGTPELGVLFNTAGMDLEYRREGAVVVNITEVTLAALTTVHADGGFLEIGHGFYRLDLPDAALATGANTVSIQGTVTGMIILPQTIQLVDFDPEDSVRLGLTALPDAVADGVGGLPISDAGGLDLDTKLANTNEITVVRMGALTDWIDAGRLDAILDLIKTAVDLIKTEADKIALVGAGAGVAGSVIEEVENRATPTQVQSELGTYDALVPADLPANFGSMGIEANGDVHADIKEWLGVAPGGLIGGAGGRVDSSVGVMAANVLNAAAINAAAFTSGKFAAGAIDANALATDAAQKIRDQILPVTNVALSNIPFIFVAASDHVTPVTGATGVSGERSIDGGAYVGVSGTITEVSDGSYQFDALAADMNGGIITFKFSATGGTPGAADDRFVTIVTNIGV